MQWPQAYIWRLRGRARSKAIEVAADHALKEKPDQSSLLRVILEIAATNQKARFVTDRSAQLDLANSQALDRHRQRAHAGTFVAQLFGERIEFGTGHGGKGGFDTAEIRVGPIGPVVLAFGPEKRGHSVINRECRPVR